MFGTMLDILCDFLTSSKEANGGLGVQYPKQGSGSIKGVSSKLRSPEKNDKSTGKIKAVTNMPPSSMMSKMARP